MYIDSGREELLEFKKGNNMVKVSLVKGTNYDSIDIREYYNNDAGELAPTKKGIRFSCENTEDVIRALFLTVEDQVGLLEELKNSVE